MSTTTIGSLKAFDDALRREVHNLARWPDLLWQQLHNRLQWEPSSVSELLASERTARSAPGGPLWMRTLTRFRESPSLIRTMYGRIGGLWTCALAPDGSFIVAAGEAGVLKIWDFDTGIESRTLPGHVGETFACAVAPDGSYLVSAGEDKTVRLWDPSSGREIHTLLGHSEAVRGCAVSPDGSLVVSTSKDRSIKIWDPRTGKCMATLAKIPGPVGHMGELGSCAVSPDSRFVIVGSISGRASYIWDAIALELVKKMPFGPVGEVAISPDGSFAVLAGQDKDEGNLMRCDLHADDAWQHRRHPPPGGAEGALFGCAVAPDGSFAVSGGRDRTLQLWGLTESSEKGLRRFYGHASSVTSCAVTGDGRFVVSTSEDGTVKVWDLSVREETWAPPGHSGTIHDCVFSPDGRLVVSAGEDGALKVADASTGETLQDLKRGGHKGQVRGCAVAPDGSFIASAGADRTLLIWDASTGNRLSKVEGAAKWALNAVRMNLASDKKFRKDFLKEGHTDEVNACVVAPDWSFMVSASKDATLKLWTLQRRRGLIEDLSATPLIVGTLQHNSMVNRCAVAPDASFIVSASADRTLKLWDPAGGDCLMTLEGHTDAVAGCAVGPDGSFIVSASLDGTLKVWDSATGAERQTLVGHSGAVFDCAISPDGSFAVSGSEDATCRLWDLATGHSIACWPFGGRVFCVSLHPSTPLMACGDTAGNAYLFELVGIEYGPLVVTAFDGRVGPVVRDAQRRSGRYLHGVEYGDGDPVFRCPACVREHPIADGWRAGDFTCPTPECGRSLRASAATGMLGKTRAKRTRAFKPGLLR